MSISHCSNDKKDAENGFFRKFYIDIVTQKFSQLFFFDRKNNFEIFEKIFSEKISKSFKDLDFSSIHVGVSTTLAKGVGVDGFISES